MIKKRMLKIRMYGCCAFYIATKKSKRSSSHAKTDKSG